MIKLVNITKTAVSTLAVCALLCGGTFAVNHAMAEQQETNIEKSDVARFALNDTSSEQTKELSEENASQGSFADVGEEKSPSVVWAPDFEETIEKMRANPEYYEEIANQVREKAQREKVEEELKASSAEKKSPAVVYAPDFEETIGKMRENSGYSPEYFDEVVSACREKGQSETMVAAE